MAFLPKNKYKKLYTNGGEFVNKSTKQNYIGPYLELPNQKFFIGKAINTLGPELERAVNILTGNIFPNRRNAAVRVFNKSYADKELNYKKPLATKVFPTQKDYLRGSMTRYFGYKIPTNKYFEIDKNTYNDISSNNNIDRSLYSAGQITWALKGDLEKINGANLLRLDIVYPGLRKLFNNLTEFGSL